MEGPPLRFLGVGRHHGKGLPFFVEGRPRSLSDVVRIHQQGLRFFLEGCPCRFVGAVGLRRQDLRPFVEGRSRPLGAALGIPHNQTIERARRLDGVFIARIRLGIYGKVCTRDFESRSTIAGVRRLGRFAE